MAAILSRQQVSVSRNCVVNAAAPPRRSRVCFTPTCSSWLNQVERWFALITNRSIRGGSFQSVNDLNRQINALVDQRNQHPKPFK